MTRPITAGLDGSPESLAAADRAAREARPLHVMYAWMLPPQTARTAQAPELRKQWAQQILYPDVPVTEHVELGNAAEVPLTAAARAGLVVVGRRTHRPAVGARLGHVAHALLHHAACAVAVVPHD